MCACLSIRLSVCLETVWINDQFNRVDSPVRHLFFNFFSIMILYFMSVMPLDQALICCIHSRLNFFCELPGKQLSELSNKHKEKEKKWDPERESEGYMRAETDRSVHRNTHIGREWERKVGRMYKSHTNRGWQSEKKWQKVKNWGSIFDEDREGVYKWREGSKLIHQTVPYIYVQFVLFGSTCNIVYSEIEKSSIIKKKITNN